MNPSPELPNEQRWENEPEWQVEQERILLYLRLLRLPGVDALEIALEALRRARQPLKDAEATPGAAAMQALREVLEERRRATAGDGQGNRFSQICLCPDLAERSGVPRDARSMPLLNRGSMKPDRL